MSEALSLTHPNQNHTRTPFLASAFCLFLHLACFPSSYRALFKDLVIIENSTRHPQAIVASREMFKAIVCLRRLSFGSALGLHQMHMDRWIGLAVVQIPYILHKRTPPTPRPRLNLPHPPQHQQPEEQQQRPGKEQGLHQYPGSSSVTLALSDLVSLSPSTTTSTTKQQHTPPDASMHAHAALHNPQGRRDAGPGPGA